MYHILIVDDHALVRQGLKAHIASIEQVSAVKEAKDGAEALMMLENHPFHVVFLDIDLPGKNGIELCRIVNQQWPEVKVIAVSMHEKLPIVKRMLKNGAKGYVSKQSKLLELEKAFEAVIRGETYLGENIQARMREDLMGLAPQQSFIPKLSRREKEILGWIIKEATTKEIADQLSISPGTVETHRRSLLSKLNARNTAGLVRIALEYGLLD